MAVPQLEPSGYVRKTWDSEYVAEALEMSGQTIIKYRTDSGSKPRLLHGVRNLFLIGAEFLKSGGTVLVGSSDVGIKWGADDIMVDISHSGRRKQWLQHAASFAGGTVYLVSLRLSDEEALIWWDALMCATTTSPNSIFILFDFTRRPSSADHLMLALRQSPRIENLAVFQSNLAFSASLEGEAIPLNTLHLEGVPITGEFLAALSGRRAFEVSRTLSLVHNIPSDRFSIMIASLKLHKFLEWQLKHLNLVGFSNGISLFDFMDFLKDCTNSSLYSMSLKDSVNIRENELRPTLVRAVIDALDHSGLALLDLGGFEQEPAIQAQLLRNQKSAIFLGVSEYSKVPAVAVRLFICGDAYAGKTTLLSTLCSVCFQSGVFDNPNNTLKRTRGIEVHKILKDDIHLSAWDMAGQTEFHAFHDHMFPDPSTTYGSPAMFMFVWSPMDSKNEEPGNPKGRIEFEASFGYWLKFISSKTRQSNTLRKLFVVFTHKDHTKLVQDLLEDSINDLAATFSKIIEVVKVLEVDARSKNSVEPLASSIFQNARSVLEGVEVYSICSEVSKYLSEVGKQPIISWDDFSNLCSEKFHVTDLEVQKAIAYSLNESGDIIYLSNLPFLVLDPNWFCNEVMGSLIHFTDQPGTIPINGYANQHYLEKLLTLSSHSIVEGSQLLALMEAMHLCCKIPGDAKGSVFIPATLSDISRHLEWKERPTVQRFSHVGRRLECDKKDLTFLTRGFFPTVQVTFNKAFFESIHDVKLGKANVERGKDFIFMCVQDIEIIVEWSLAKGEHVIDVMARAPVDDEDAGETLVYIVNKISKTVIGVCAQPVGNQGVKLVEGIIRPHCLHKPAPPDVRADQCALILDLKQELKEQLEGGQRYDRLCHKWEENNFYTDHFIDLLGTEEFEQILMTYRTCLQGAARLVQENLDFQSASTSGQAASQEVIKGKGLMQEDINVASPSGHVAGKEVVGNSTASQGKKDGTETQDSLYIREESTQIKIGKNEQPADAMSKSMIKGIFQKLESMDAKIVGLQSSVNSMHGDIGRKLDNLYKSIIDIRSHALPKIQRLVEQCLNFAIENEDGKIPRFVIFTRDDKPSVQRRLVRAILREVKHVRILIACEHRDAPHFVEGQEGPIVSTTDADASIRKALPYINGFLKVLTLAAKVGAHVLAGAGSAVPDLSKLVALVLDSPGFLDFPGLTENISISPGEDFNEWRECLAIVLAKDGGINDINISNKFKLRRALYTDTSHVAWLCDLHYKGKDQRPFPLTMGKECT